MRVGYRFDQVSFVPIAGADEFAPFWRDARACAGGVLANRFCGDGVPMTGTVRLAHRDRRRGFVLLYFRAVELLSG